MVSKFKQSFFTSLKNFINLFALFGVMYTLLAQAPEYHTKLLNLYQKAVIYTLGKGSKKIMTFLVVFYY